MSMHKAQGYVIRARLELEAATGEYKAIQRNIGFKAGDRRVKVQARC